MKSMIPLLFAWNDYFSNPVGTIMTKKFAVDKGTIYVHDCYFEGYGKVINCTGEVTKLLVEYVTFNKVHDDFRAGCIFVECNCECVLTKSCCYHCYSSGLASFAFLFYGSKGSCVLNETSINKCQNQGTATSMSTCVVICIAQGKQQINNINGSYNSADTFIFEQSGDRNDNLSRYSTLAYNKASICCMFYMLGTSSILGKFAVDHCNFVSNYGSSESTTICILDSYAFLSVQNSVFSGNNVTFLFQAFGRGSIVVENTYIPENEYHKISGSVTFSKPKFESKTHYFNHFATHLCPNADNNVVALLQNSQSNNNIIGGDVLHIDSMKQINNMKEVLNILQ